jgi:hypothetical protein
MKLEEYLAIPYIIAASSVLGQDRRYVCRVEHPELDQCAAEAPSIMDALDQLEKHKIAYIKTCLSRGVDVPAPRSPLGDLLTH